MNRDRRFWSFIHIFSFAHDPLTSNYYTEQGRACRICRRLAAMDGVS